jgi:hypothetical protein
VKAPPLLLVGAFAALVAFATPPRGDYVRLEKVPSVDVVPGGFATARVSFTVREGFHVQANPAATPQLVATVLSFPPAAKGAALVLGPVDYPPGQPYRLRGSDRALSTYSGSVTLEVSVAASAKAKPGVEKVQTTLRYQACDDTTCFFPQTDTVEIPVRILAAAKR